jgi:hypothetical protein
MPLSATGPYPYEGANLLKLYTDFQVFLVAIVGLIMRMDSATLAQEQFGKDFYGNALLVVLVGTLVPVCFTVLFQTPVERAVAALKKDAENAYSQAAVSDDKEVVSGKGSSSSPVLPPRSDGTDLNQVDMDVVTADDCNTSQHRGTEKTVKPAERQEYEEALKATDDRQQAQATQLKAAERSRVEAEEKHQAQHGAAAIPDAQRV